MFIQTESTPNPATLKFLPGRPVLGAGNTAEFPDEEAAQSSPLAAKLFEIDEVASIFYGEDFIAITKSRGEWQHLKPALLGAIMDHFTRDLPLFHEDRAPQPAGDEGSDDNEIVVQIKELLDTRVRPAVAQDGGDIIFSRFDETSGIVYLQMRGACEGCPSSTMTLKHGIENLLRHFVPEVNEVRPV